MGLDAYEYECVRGVKISQSMAETLGAAARNNDISLSIHAPYYINLASEDEATRTRSREHIFKSLRAAHWMGARAVAIHAGTSTVRDRAAALDRIVRELDLIMEEAARDGLDGLLVRPETLGKPSQPGMLEDILQLCRRIKGLQPTIDFGHLHAATQGSLLTKEDFQRVLDRIVAVLGPGVLRDMHIHFSPIEYTGAGEKRHRTTAEPGFGPAFQPLAEALLEAGAGGTVVCESFDNQADDAVVFREIYRRTAKAAG
jgi:deoxyribonuclease-4